MFDQRLGQGEGGGQTVRAGVPHHFTHHDTAAQMGPAGDDHGFHGISGPGMGHDTGDFPIFHKDFHNFGLFYPQVVLFFQGVLHDLLVFPAVGLGTEGPDGRPFAPVEQAVLDAGLVGGLAHLAAQRVQLPDEMALAGAADGGVAGHIAHRVQIYGEAQGAHPHPGSGQGSLDAGVAGTDDGDIKFSRVISFHKIGFLWVEITYQCILA